MTREFFDLQGCLIARGAQISHFDSVISRLINVVLMEGDEIFANIVRSTPNQFAFYAFLRVCF